MKYLLTIFAFMLILPAAASAQPLVPCSGLDCGTCEFVALGNSLLQWLILILFAIFAVVIAIAGFGLVTSGGNPSAKEAAKSKFLNGIVGIIIVLVAWLLVDTVMRGLLQGGEGVIAGWGPWSEVQCINQIGTAYLEATRDSLENGPTEGWDGDIDDIGQGNEAVVAFAEAMMARGCSYNQARRNACQGNPGYTDCSDLVNAAYQTAGLRSPGTYTGNMIQNATPVGDPATLRPGDSLIYRNGNSGHVVICMDEGCSQVIHASGQRDDIKISSSGYYLDRNDIRVIRTSDFE